MRRRLLPWLVLDILAGLYLLAVGVLVLCRDELPLLWALLAIAVAGLTWALTREAMITEWLGVAFLLGLAWILLKDALGWLVAPALSAVAGWVTGAGASAARGAGLGADPDCPGPGRGDQVVTVPYRVAQEMGRRQGGLSMSVDHSAVLLDKIARHQARVGVVGLGYVGLPLACALAEETAGAVGVDVDAAKVAQINAGESYVGDVPAAQVRALVEAGKLRVTTSYAGLAPMDAIIICVPTPLSKTRDPDISYIISAADEIARILRPGQLVVLESTTYPGTTEEILLPRLAQGQYAVGRDFFLAFSPERIDPGNQHYNIRNTPKVLGGMTPTCLAVAQALYGLIVERVVPVSSTRAAEMVKLLENTFRAVNIGLINEVALMCHRLGISVWEVIEAASTKPYGFMPFYPGPGLGGHCIPLDPQYLAWKLRTLNYNARFIQVATEINLGMPHHVVTMVVDALNARRLALNGSRVLVLGVAYKPNVADVRESPALEVITLLRDKGALVEYHDPHVPALRFDGFALTSGELTDALLAAADCVVIVTPHGSYDWGQVIEHARLIIDTRNATGRLAEGREHIIKL